MNLDYTDDAAGARENAERGIALLEQLHAQAPEDDTLTRDLGSAYTTAGSTLLGEQVDPAGLDRSIELHNKALALDLQAVHEDTRNYDAVRSLMADHINLINMNNVKHQYREADSHCREALKLSPRPCRLRIRRTRSRPPTMRKIEMHCARARRGLADMAEAERLASRCIGVLTKALAAGDNLQIQYTLGACEEVQASVHAHRAASAGASRAAQQSEWHRARELFIRALSRASGPWRRP